MSRRTTGRRPRVGRSTAAMRRALPRGPLGWLVLGLRLVAAVRVLHRLAAAARPTAPLHPTSTHDLRSAAADSAAVLDHGGDAASRPVELGGRPLHIPSPAVSLHDYAPPDTPPATRRPNGGRMSGPASISVIVPARDEAERIGPCLATIVGAPGVVEVIVVDDESTDATAALAAEAGATVLTGRTPPPGWAGKAWALEQGLRAARGEWVVTLDADTRPDPALPVALVDRMAADGTDFATVAACFDCPTAGSRWLHAAMLTTLVYRFGPPGDGAALANGQCMAAQRARWLEAGGMGPVAAQVVEDVALARSLAARGWHTAMYDGADLLTVRMFETLATTWTGWGRSLGLPGVESDSHRLVALGELTVTMVLPTARLASRLLGPAGIGRGAIGRFDPLDAVLLVARLGTLAGTRRVYTRGGAAYWLSPLADPVAVAALTGSLLHPRRRWRGRPSPSP